MPTIFQHKVVSGEVTFNERSSRPSGAHEWGVDVLDGWSTTPRMKVISTEIGGLMDGEISSDFFPLQARYVIVGGWVLASTAHKAEELHDVLVRDAFPRNKIQELVRYEAVPKLLRTKRAGEIEIEWAMENGFRWLVTLLAEDPLKYSLDRIEASGGVSTRSGEFRTYPRFYPLVYVSSGGVGGEATVAHNIGTARVLPTITLFGPLPRNAWRLVNETNGGELWYDVAVPASSVFEIDFYNQVARMNGYAVSSAVTGTFWGIDPGINRIRLYSSEAEGAGFSVSARSAWE